MGADLAVTSDRPAAPEARRRRSILLAAAFGTVLLIAAYSASAIAYRSSIHGSFSPPPTRPDAVAVVLMPNEIDTTAQLVATEILIFPGEQLLTSEGRLLHDISLDTYATGSGTIAFPRGSVPAPIRAQIPVTGLVQDYPFDHYQYNVQARAVLERSSGTTLVPQAVPMALSVYFKVPGWGYQSTADPQGFTSQAITSEGRIGRAGGTITIALIFISLIVMFGVLSVVAVVAGRLGRFELTISTASWLTSAVFALIALRNALPGHPPLGSWMDVLAYFWVIAAIMVMIGATVATLVIGRGGSAKQPKAPKALS